MSGFYTMVPNTLFTTIRTLTEAELKILLIIVRRTYGWTTSDGERKQRDRISRFQFIDDTGLSRRVVSTAIQLLIDKGMILVTDERGLPLRIPKDRVGKRDIFYSYYVKEEQNYNHKGVDSPPSKGQNLDHNKRNVNKEKEIKVYQKRGAESAREIKELLRKYRPEWVCIKNS